MPSNKNNKISLAGMKAKRNMTNETDTPVIDKVTEEISTNNSTSIKPVRIGISLSKKKIELELDSNQSSTIESTLEETQITPEDIFEEKKPTKSLSIGIGRIAKSQPDEGSASYVEEYTQDEKSPEEKKAEEKALETKSGIHILHMPTQNDDSHIVNKQASKKYSHLINSDEEQEDIHDITETEMKQERVGEDENEDEEIIKKEESLNNQEPIETKVEKEDEDEEIIKQNIEKESPPIIEEKKEKIIPTEKEPKEETIKLGDQVLLNKPSNLFSNYESDFSVKENSIISKIKKLKHIPKTRPLLVGGLIGVTTLGIGGLFYLDPKDHSISRYKTAIIGYYNNGVHVDDFSIPDNNGVITDPILGENINPISEDLSPDSPVTNEPIIDITPGEDIQKWDKEKINRGGFSIEAESQTNIETNTKIYKYKGEEYGTLDELYTIIDIDVGGLKKDKVEDFLLPKNIAINDTSSEEQSPIEIETPNQNTIEDREKEPQDVIKEKKLLDFLSN